MTVDALGMNRFLQIRPGGEPRAVGAKDDKMLRLQLEVPLFSYSCPTQPSALLSPPLLHLAWCDSRLFRPLRTKTERFPVMIRTRMAMVQVLIPSRFVCGFVA
jgi:hypothetical protein